MKYFLFGNARLNPEIVPLTAVDAGGKSLMNKHDNYPTGVECCYFDTDGKLELPDKPPSIGMELILSSRVGWLLGHVRACRGIKSIPSCFRDARTGDIYSTAFKLWFSTVAHDVLNVSKSRVRFYKQRILTIEEWCLDSKKVPPLDLFLGPKHQWLVSHRLVNLFDEHLISGCEFIEVALS